METFGKYQHLLQHKKGQSVNKFQISLAMETFGKYQYLLQHKKGQSVNKFQIGPVHVIPHEDF